MTRIGWAAAVAAALLAGNAGAQDVSEIGDSKSGGKLAREECRSCHDVSARPGKPSLRGRPPNFYDVANMASTTPTSLYVFLHSSHPTMPNFRLDKKESDDVIAYIMSLRRQTP
jgi:mono/diheme cytochrome c family protein